MPASKTATINEISSTTIPELTIGKVWRELLGAFQGTHTRVPGRPGAWYTSSKRGIRVMRWECFVLVNAVDAEDRRAAVTAIADWVDYDQEVKITISDMPGKYYMGVLGDVAETDEWREAGIFELSFIIQPYAYDNSITVEAWTSTANTNHTWNPNITTPLWPVIHIKPTNGTLTGFTLESNGDTLIVACNVASGNVITVNSIVPVVVTGPGIDVDLTGAFDPASVILLGTTGTFPTLMPDMVNNIHFTKTGGTATSFDISVEYRKTYRD